MTVSAAFYTLITTIPSVVLTVFILGAILGGSIAIHFKKGGK